MTAMPGRSPCAVVAAVLLLASSWTLASAENAPGRIADKDGIFVDGQTFEVVYGRARVDASAQVKNLNARELGPAAIVFRSGDKLYVAGVPLRLQGSGTGPDVYVTAEDDPPGFIRLEY